MLILKEKYKIVDERFPSDGEYFLDPKVPGEFKVGDEIEYMDGKFQRVRLSTGNIQYTDVME